MSDKKTPITTRDLAAAADRSGSFLQQLQEHLTFLRQCLLCKADYKSQWLRILYERGPIHLLHATCGNCQNAVLALVSISEMGMSSLGLYTDLTAEDLKHFAKEAPITEDDVLEFSKYLHQSHKSEKN